MTDLAQLAREGRLTEAELARAAQRGDTAALAAAADELEVRGELGFEYYMARYEAMGGQGSPEDREALLAALLDASYHPQYLLERAVLQAQLGDGDGALRTLRRMARYYREGEAGERSRRAIALLEGPEGVRGFLDAFGPMTRRGGAPAPSAPPPAAQPRPPAAPRPDSQPVAGPTPKPAAAVPREETPVLPPEIAAEFDALVGLDSVKQQLYEFYRTLQFQAVRSQRLGTELKDERGYHFVLYGNPGTGKTTVARIIAKILFSLHIREKDTFLETDRSGLVSAYIGETEKQVREKLESARGGVIFIDEAYALYRKNSDKDVGKEAIDTLLKDMEDHRTEYTVILAGYRGPMEEMLREANPGFRSRFPYHIHIPDYTTEQLIEIAEKMAKKKAYLLTDGAKRAIAKRIDRERVDETFGNARFIRGLMEEAETRIALRLEDPESATAADMMSLLPQDFGEEPETGEDALNALMAELDGLVGLSAAKAKVAEIVSAVKVRREAERRGLSLGDNLGTLHLIFKGNAGTGKTTVARILGKIYKELGVLKRGDVFVECTRADLVGRYQGHTAENTKKVVASALGGILFVDEAYALSRDEHDSFGQEAVDTLVAEIENHRDSLMVILAGYSGDMDAFLTRNQGLSSRLSNEVVFADYAPEEMAQIFMSMLSGKGLTLVPEAVPRMEALIADRSAARDFGNARGVRNLVDGAIRAQNRRLAAEMEAGRPLEDSDFQTILPQDLEL